MKKILLLIVVVVFSLSFISENSAQTDKFRYSVSLNPLTIPGLPGLHSFVSAQYKGKWLIIGGRRDGSHARQPFRSFPGDENNTDIYVIDVSDKMYKSSSINVLPVSLKEQLQSGNMNYYQDGSILYITGGYAYSESEEDHITFPYLTSVSVPDLIEAVLNGTPINSHFRQIKDTVFAVTGGQMGKIDKYFYIIGGQRFDGRYNPMGHPTYKQTYVDGYIKFKIFNSGSGLSYSNPEFITDQVNLHRRDYNLLPQIFPDGSSGYTVSSGVFRRNVNLPFLYPVNISESGFEPVISFNQYLCNYHAAKMFMYDKKNNQMHTIFFGGISQYYLKDNELINDKSVPYVRTISRLSRYSDGSLHEFALPVEMPSYTGSNGEFMPVNDISLFPNGIIDLNKLKGDSILIGHIYGGIISTEINPFTKNNNESTSAENMIYEVRLIKNKTQNKEIDGSNPFTVNVFKHATSEMMIAELNIPYDGSAELSISNNNGIIIFEKSFKKLLKGTQTVELTNNQILTESKYNFNFTFDNRFEFIKEIQLNN